MAITNFDFPGVTLRQEFNTTLPGATSTLGVLCVGPQFLTHSVELGDAATAEITGGTINSAIDNCTVTAGAMTVTLNGGTAYETTVQNAGTVLIDSGWFNYAEITGGTAGTAKSINVDQELVPVTTNYSAATYGLGVQPGDLVAFEISDDVYTAYIQSISGGTSTTKITLSTVGATKDGQADALTALTSGTEVSNLKLQRQASATGTATIASTGAVTFVPSSVTVSKADLLGGGATGSATLYGGTIALEYDEKVTGGSQSFVNQRGALSDPDDVVTVLGTIKDSNPLAVAVYCALIDSNNTPVFFTATSAETVNGYTRAVNAMDRYSDIYSIVLATSTETTNYADIVEALDNVVVSIANDEDSKIRRVLWYGAKGEGDGNELIRTVIDSRLTNDYRSQCVWADGITVLGNAVGTYAVAAAAAGMRSYEPVQRPISNLTFNSFRLAESNALSRSEQKEIAMNGVWVVSNNEAGSPITLRQLTTAADPTNINKNEESIVANADEIALALCHVGEDLVGCSNIHPELLMSLADTISAIMDYRTINTTGSIYVGPQLLSWSLDALEQDPVNLDHVYASVTCEPPKPFNKFAITLRVV